MKLTTYYIKSSILFLLLVGESYYLSTVLMGYVRSGNFFAPSTDFLIKVVVLLLLILYTYFLTVGGWGKWEQYVLVSLPISAGIGLRAFQSNSTYGLLIGLLAFILISYDVFLSTRLKDQMVAFNPRIILKFATRGVLFTFALVAAIFVFIDTPEDPPSLNLGERVGNIAQNQFDNIIAPTLNQEAQNTVSEFISEGENYMEGRQGINLDLRNTVEDRFNEIIAPYQNFIPPLIALIVFALVRFLGTITGWIFTATIGFVFVFFKKAGFLKVNHKMVQKEEIGFESEME